MVANDKLKLKRCIHHARVKDLLPEFFLAFFTDSDGHFEARFEYCCNHLDCHGTVGNCLLDTLVDWCLELVVMLIVTNDVIQTCTLLVERCVGGLLHALVLLLNDEERIEGRQESNIFFESKLDLAIGIGCLVTDLD